MFVSARNSALGVLSLSAALLAPFAAAQLAPQHYTLTNLTADQAGVAPVTDANLVNPWGLSRSSGGPWWDSDNGTGLSTLYDGKGAIIPLVVTIPGGAPKTTGSPTGTIFNGGNGFAIAPGQPAIFLFATEDGTISGWNPNVNPKSAVITLNTKGSSVFKGMTMASVTDPFLGPAEYLYLADFRRGVIQIYDTKFHRIPYNAPDFRDDELPAGYAPFNVQNIGGNLYVTYALQDSARHDNLSGTGFGYVDVFTPSGTLLRRLEHGDWFNAPWGIVEAPSDFGIHSHQILVGNFGSGQIAAFNQATGAFEGFLMDAHDQPIQIPGLWGLSFGNDAKSGNATSLYFAAGTGGEQHGLLGTITAVENAQGNDY